jgi:predicted dehydrogenase
MTDQMLVCVGVSPWTALGRELVAAGVRTVDEADEAFRARAAHGVVVGTETGDPVSAALAAVRTGRPVLIEPVAQCGPDGLREVARAADEAGVAAVAAFRRRSEPDLEWARGSVAGGSIGLPWGVHAEALRAATGDPLSEALDLLDAVAWASGLRPVAVVSVGRSARAADRGVPVVLSVAFDHGGVGQVVARTPGIGESSPGPELASFRITGSHGTIQGDLDGPALDRHPEAAGSATTAHIRVDASGTRRLFEAFQAVAAGESTGPSLVGLAVAADLLDLVGARPRTR